MNEVELELASLLALPQDRSGGGKAFVAAAVGAAKEQKYDILERRDPETMEILAIEVWRGARRLHLQELTSEKEIPTVTLVALIAAIRKYRGLPP